MTPLILPVAELKTGLTGLGKLINPKSTLPVLRSVRIERTPDGWICLTATDLDHFVTLRLEQPAKGEPFAMLVSHAELLRLTKSSPKNERLQLEPGADHWVTIQSTLGGGIGQTQIKSLPVDEFPTIPKVVTDKPFPVSEELRNAIHEAFACCSTDPTRAVLHGAFLDVTRPKAHYVVATDGRHLYSCNSFHLPFKRPFILPRHKFLAWREFNLDGPWQMKASDSSDAKSAPMVQLSSRRWRFIARPIEGPFPRWRCVIPDQKPLTIIELKPSQLHSVIQTIQRLPCHDEHHHTIRLDRKDRQMWLWGKAQPSGPWTPVPVNIHTTEGRDVTVSLDRLLLLKALQFGLSRIDIIDENSPLRFSCSGRQMIVMPLRGGASGPGSTPRPSPSTPLGAPARAPLAPPTTPPPSAEPTRTPSMPHPEENPTTQNGAHGTPPREPEERPALEAALARLETLKAGCRELVAELTRLSEVLKQVLRDQRVSHRETQTMRSTLPSLQSLRI